MLPANWRRRRDDSVYNVPSVWCDKGDAVRVLWACLLAVAGANANAAFNTWGDVNPTGPSSWTSSTMGYVGDTSNGTLTVDSGSDLLSSSCYIGYNSGVSGTMKVDGAGLDMD